MDRQLEKLKAQEDKEFREMQNRYQLLENKFVDEHKVNNAENFREIVKEQMEEEMKKNTEVTEKILQKETHLLLCTEYQKMSQIAPNKKKLWINASSSVYELKWKLE